MSTLSSTLTSLSPFLLFGTAAAFVAATAWNDAVQAGISQYYPDKATSFKAKMVYAFVVTLIIIALVWFAQWLATRIYK